MEDEQIVRLYWDRNEQAIRESSIKYGAYCGSIARNILANEPDVEECVNDTWLNAWRAMPPHRPSVLSTFLGKITRNLAFNLYKKLHRDKRGGHTMDLVLDELEELVSGRDDPEQAALSKALGEEISHFLNTLTVEKQHLFVLRYWYAESIPDIAKRFGMSENNVSVSLSRIRAKLRQYLIGRGYSL